MHQELTRHDEHASMRRIYPKQETLQASENLWIMITGVQIDCHVHQVCDDTKLTSPLMSNRRILLSRKSILLIHVLRAPNLCNTRLPDWIDGMEAILLTDNGDRGSRVPERR